MIARIVKLYDGYRASDFVMSLGPLKSLFGPQDQPKGEGVQYLVQGHKVGMRFAFAGRDATNDRPLN